MPALSASIGNFCYSGHEQNGSFKSFSTAARRLHLLVGIATCSIWIKIFTWLRCRHSSFSPAFSEDCGSRGTKFFSCPTTPRLGLKSHEIPLQIVRQPLPQLEAGGSRSPVAPGGGCFGDRIAGKKGLYRDLQTQFKSALALDADGAQHAAIVNLEGIGCVMCRYPAEPAQGHSGEA